MAEIKIRIEVQGRAVLIERLYSDKSVAVVVMPLINAAQADIKANQLACLFGLNKVNEMRWEN